MMEGQPAVDRQLHVILDAGSREQKAAKIISLLSPERIKAARRILEVGCGSGVIAGELARLGGDQVEVHAVDVEDNRVQPEGYHFQLVTDATLPFEPGYFDIVISNYVIEHVANDEDQLVHLQEIARVLHADGVAYLGLPNRWRLVEPHFRLPLLSWFPRRLSDAYVRVTGRGTRYDCLPLSLGRARALIGKAGLHERNITLAALRETLAVEQPTGILSRVVRRLVPDWCLALGIPIMPVYIFLLTKAGHASARGSEATRDWTKQ